METIINILRSFARAHRASILAKQGDYKKAQEVISREYEVHP